MKKKKKVKIFISGPMSGMEDFNTPLFNRVEELLRERGFSPFNPAWMKVDDNWDCGDLLSIDIAALNMCDAICMLPGWLKSTGARLEYDFAVKAGKDIFFVDANATELRR